jgi:hypothetical protein
MFILLKIIFTFILGGSGAPIRDPSTNEVVTRLPYIEGNLWTTSYDKFHSKSTTE